MKRVYICYTREDYDTANFLANFLREEGVKVFLDKDTIPVGSEWERQIQNEITSSDAVILLWSRHSAKSPWVTQELSRALITKRQIIPCSIDSEPMTPLVEHLQILTWDGGRSAMDRLKDALGISPKEELSVSSSLHDAIKVFNDWIIKNFGSLKMLGQGASYPMEEVYLPLNLQTISKGEISRTFPAQELLNKSLKPVIVRGGPGSGKTTLLKYLAFLSSTNNSFFPIYVRIPEWVKVGEPIDEYISIQIKGQVGRRHGQAIIDSDQFARSGTLLLLDALDEINENEYRSFLQQLANFSMGHPDCRIIIATRHAGLQIHDFQNYLICDLKELAVDDIERYIWTVSTEEARGQIWNTIRNDSRLFALAKTPFLLAMMCTSPNAFRGSRAQKSTLFEQCTRYLLKELYWEDEENLPNKPNEETVKILEGALKIIAVRFFKLDEKGPFEEQEIEPIIRKAGYTKYIPSEIIKMIEYSGLLQRTGSSLYFVHRSIWEYFVALGMQDEDLENLLVRANTPMWEEPIRLYVGLALEKDLNSVLEGLWNENKGLTLRAMMDLKDFPHTLLENLIGDLSRQERLRLVYQLEDTVHTLAVREELEAKRMLLDTVSALFRIEKDSQVIFECIRLLEDFAREYNCQDCHSLMAGKLDLNNASKRRIKYLSDASFCFDFIKVSGGTFNMGINDYANGINAAIEESPRHPVTVSPYWIGKHQITNQHYYDEFPFGVDRRDQRSDQYNQPATAVAWYDAYIFAKWLGCDLPTEAEWEFACRSGSSDDENLFDHGKIPEYAWYVQNSFNTTHPVGTRKPNSFGIHDMLGNVREWCKDYFDTKYYAKCEEQGLVQDPQGPEEGTRRVLRGGCFDWNVANMMPTYRNYNPPDQNYFCNGFRVVFRGEDPWKEDNE